MGWGGNLTPSTEAIPQPLTKKEKRKMKTFKAIKKSNGKKYVLHTEIRTVIPGVDLVSPDDLVQPGEIYYRGWLENSKNGQTYDFHPDEFEKSTK